ncbi:MAG: tetratricopeptide repeat protein [Agathobacter sp.]|nr:tetratricopeptide repeat protein [Agathobacter sp.]
MSYENLSKTGFIKEIKESSTGHHPRRFCFVLGAGSSKTSGIKSGQDLVKIWDEELHERDSESHQTWKNSLGITNENMSNFYSQYYEKRFNKHPTDGYNFLEKLMDVAKPSIGYVMLAHLLTNTPNNVIITTNFDHLVEDAINYYSQEIPLVIGHESLAHYINKNITRPTIIKIHRDLLFDPKNTSVEVESLHTNWKTALEKIFSDYHPVFIGYAGNDNSLMDYLLDKSEHFFTHEWCTPYWLVYKTESLPNKVDEFLKKSEGYLVRHSGFDEIMCLLGVEFNYQLPSEDTFLLDARKRYKDLSDSIDAFTEKSKGTEIITINDTIVIETQEEDPDIDNAIQQITNQSALQRMYREANELDEQNKYEEALLIKKKLIEKEPNNPRYHHSLGTTLRWLRKYEDAMTSIKQAIELEPNNSDFHHSLSDIYYYKEQYEDALHEINIAIKLNPYDSFYYCSKGTILSNLNRYEEAIESTSLAIKMNPELPSHYNTISVIYAKMKLYEEGITACKKAIALDPDSACYYDTLAFIYELNNQFEEAIPYAEKAVELDSNTELYQNRLAKLKKYTENNQNI